MREHSLTLNPAALAAWLLALLSATLPAQTCLGGASFANRHAQIGADYAGGSSTRLMTVGASLGARRGPFVTVSGGRAQADNVPNDATQFGVLAAMSTPPLDARETALCPFLSLAIMNGVTLPDGATTFSRTYSAGFGLGTTLDAGGGFQAVPFASAALVLPTTDIVHIGSALPLGWTDENYLAASLGVGFVFGHVLTIRPSTDIATHGRTAQSFGLRVSVAFGQVTVPPPPRPGEGSLATVWANPRAMVYYCAGSRSYGNTADGQFMTEREAIAAGYTADLGKRC